MNDQQIAAESERLEAEYLDPSVSHAPGYRNGWWKRAAIARAEQAELQGAIAAQNERQRQAGERCGVPYEQHGCDWPEWVADRVLEQKSEIERLRERVREFAKGKLLYFLKWQPLQSVYAWEQRSEEIDELAHEAGVWFDDDGNEVDLEVWKGMVVA